MKAGDLIEVEWYDCTGDTSWTCVDDAAEMMPRIVTSVGYYISECENVVRISTHSMDNDSFGFISLIPAGCVFKIRLLRYADEETHE